MSLEALDPLQKNHQDAIKQVVDGRTDWDAWLLRLSDWCNPILVKETRQALKSRQFSITFILTMLAVLIWTIFGILMMVPGIYYVPGGASLLMGYFFILMVPVCVIVPMSAFRSMASELEEGTHDVLSLSSLSSRQIVLGKLSVAALQTIVYFSALTPCIALTYILRGVGLSAILLILATTLGLSLAFSTIAILLATMARSREQQVLMTLILFFIFFPISFMWIGGAVQIITNPPPINTMEFLFMVGSIGMFGLCYVWLFVLCASARIGFASDNHSTRIRWMLLILHCLYLIVPCSVMAYENRVDHEIWYIFSTLIGVHWAVAGVMMLGERGTISPRARRTLPTTFFGRAFFSWFNPGGGPGYVFAVTTYFSTVLFLIIVQLVPWKLQFQWSVAVHWYVAAIGGYLAFYLGIARLFSLLLNRRFRNRMIGITALTITLVVFGIGIPVSLSYWETGFMTIEYRFYSFTNIFWTLALIAEEKGEADVGVIWLIVGSIVVFTTNLLLVTRDVMLVRIEVPPKVRQETGHVEPMKEESINPLALDS